MSQQVDLMYKILGLYTKRYSGKELETKFNAACEDLIDTGDIDRSSYMLWCIDNNIEPVVKPKKPKTYSSDGCGGGGRRYTMPSC